ncbi:cysteine hydrolase family protein [Liquorilactobacillus capillatus]|uniref:Amidase n=1 Tax=Liquorilactobacillus capillatus DSM 19910 TaxID=1423731 RepID=A0A0R1LZB3_9LACO|nr:cysteine hydrolase family protein [Liquorilactobacillus capillatus]KRL00935.1 amidase [Liquorilactobacillus capillatus DSM 19910]
MKQALIIIDVQNDYFKNGKMELVNPQKALVHVNKLEKSFKARKLPVIYIQHINDDPDASFFGRGTRGALLHSALMIDNNVLIVEKQYPNSFLKTNLKEVLDSLKVEQLVITGMMTHMCVDSTTRASRELGYSPIVISDATATKDLGYGKNKVLAKDVQVAFLAALQTFAQVTTTEKYLSKIE